MPPATDTMPPRPSEMTIPRRVRLVAPAEAGSTRRPANRERTRSGAIASGLSERAASARIWAWSRSVAVTAAGSES